MTEMHFKVPSEGENVDYYDKAGRDLLANLNLQGVRGGTTSQWNNLDAIYAHPSSGGVIYVGNATAAESMEILSGHNISHVVNCTNGAGAIPCFHKGKLKYYTFPISQWWAHVKDNNHASVITFTDPLWAFIDSALEVGSSVLVHCLAGAHRAGTTGCACLMHYGKMKHKEAIKTAKQLRPIIDPIGQLPQFLMRLEAAENVRAAGGKG
jgi:hypothetical protein